MNLWHLIVAMCLGLGLAAACGFRVFLPPLLMGIFSRAELITLGDSWQWFSSDWAIALFGAAALFEIFGYFIPWLDNLLDMIASPLAITAGTILTSASLNGIDPSLQWILALIAGVGVTGSVQASTVLVRGLSTATTGGLGNPIVTIIEDTMSVIVAITAILAPVLAIALLVAIFFLLRRVIKGLRRKKRLQSA